MILRPEAESVLVYAKADRSISLVPTAVVRSTVCQLESNYPLLLILD
jgi:hypothetical protein